MPIKQLNRTGILFVIMLSVGLICTLALGGCGSDTDTPSGPSEPENGTEPAPSDTSEPTGLSGTEVWRVSTGEPVWAIPVVGLDGTVYLKMDDGSIHAVSPMGEKLWVFEHEEGTASLPAVDQTTGVIYVGSGSKYSGVLYAIGPDGTRLWKTSVPANITSQPVIGPLGMIYVGGSKGVHAIDPDTRTIRWSESFVYSAHPFEVTPDNILCVLVGSFMLGALSMADGMEFWRFELEKPMTGPAAGKDGTIYFGTNEGYVYALNPDGTEQWHFGVGKAIQYRPVIGEDGILYVATTAQSVHAIDHGGTLAWQFETERRVGCRPVVGPDGTLYVTDARVYALSPEGEKLWRFQTGGLIHGIAWGPGVIYFVSQDLNLYAVYQ